MVVRIGFVVNVAGIRIMAHTAFLGHTMLMVYEQTVQGSHRPAGQENQQYGKSAKAPVCSDLL